MVLKLNKSSRTSRLTATPSNTSKSIPTGPATKLPHYQQLNDFQADVALHFRFVHIKQCVSMRERESVRECVCVYLQLQLPHPVKWLNPNLWQAHTQ